MIDERKTAAEISKKPQKMDPEKVPKNRVDPEKTKKKCYYGHATTSLKDRRGRQQWLFSPTPPWPGIPSGRILCQACYEASYQAARKGQTAKIRCKDSPEKMAKTKDQDSNAKDDKNKEDQCTACAEDELERFVQYDFHLAWLRMWALSNDSTNHCYGFCTARPPG
jgi:hypothetical protein